MSQFQLSLGGIATLACLLEVSAPKPGNVHRAADFEDVSFVDFATSAVVLGTAIDSGRERSLGQTILTSVLETRKTVGTNTNLGIVLLIVPLSKIAATRPGSKLESKAVSEYMTHLSDNEGADVYEAIRIAKPGGLGIVDQADVNALHDTPIELLKAMQIAAPRDAIARQYVTGYRDIFEVGIPLLTKGRKLFGDLGQGIVFAHVNWLAREPDSLIMRKCGQQTAEHSQFLASKAIYCLSGLEQDQKLDQQKLDSFWSAVADLDFWLRSDGHRRNPGTTADLIAASLFAGIYNGNISAPFK